jgi:lipid II:glycine glycyltransferase (peptidoglycan interpeptide bridge formation enzyme)
MRMNELMQETLARTGAQHVEQDYAPIIRLATEAPTLVRLVGLFQTRGSGAQSLVAFALGVNNGDHVAYDIGASARIEDLRQLSMGYPLLWDLITWARAQGVAWFDFGGVSVQRDGEHDPLARISDFKRRFAKDVIRVSEEWVWSPRPIRDRLARSLAQSAAIMGELSRRRRH